MRSFEALALTLAFAMANAQGGERVEMFEVDTTLRCMTDYDCDQEAYLLEDAPATAVPIGVNPATGAVNVCCATFPHMDMQGLVVKEKFCFPRSVLRNEPDQRYLKPGQWNAYPLAYCDYAFSFWTQTTAALVAASIVLSMQFV